jgi:hypothetical protein
MEADGVTRVFLLKDEFMGESTTEIHPRFGRPLDREESKATIDRTDIIYSHGGIIWGDKVPVIEQRVEVDRTSLRELCTNTEESLGRVGLTILIDQLSPEDMRYAGEDHDYDGGSE